MGKREEGRVLGFLEEQEQVAGFYVNGEWVNARKIDLEYLERHRVSSPTPEKVCRTNELVGIATKMLNEDVPFGYYLVLRHYYDVSVEGIVEMERREGTVVSNDTVRQRLCRASKKFQEIW